MVQGLWDRAAPSFDHEPDHGLADHDVRRAWRDLLVENLPAAPARLADLGCGTGTLTRLLTDEGYAVDGVDISLEMIIRARAKVPEARFLIGDVTCPPLRSAEYDVVLTLHVLWALPDPLLSIARWVELLRPGGRLVLIEGAWSTGAGLSATDAERIVRSVRDRVTIRPLPDRTGASRSTTKGICC